jgi:hypothetical protein
MPRRRREGGEPPLSPYDNALCLKNCGADPLVRSRRPRRPFCSAVQPDQGVRRGRGRPPY